MTLEQFKTTANQLNNLSFQLQDGTNVPAHFHLTEIGLIQKTFIDCGGVLRQEKKVGFQLWTANDFDHRLSREKLAGIIALGENKLGLGDWEIEVEYQMKDTIGKFGLEWNGEKFLLSPTQTDCLAKDNCGIPEIQLNENNYKSNDACCTPGGGCC